MTRLQDTEGQFDFFAQVLPLPVDKGGRRHPALFDGFVVQLHRPSDPPGHYVDVCVNTPNADDVAPGQYARVGLRFLSRDESLLSWAETVGASFTLAEGLRTIAEGVIATR